MTKTNIHVVPHKNGWAIKKEGSERASLIASTKKEAEKEGRQMARMLESELIIHGKDGSIQNSDSFGNDPNPPKDKK
jgi:hypothetical protein